LGERILSPFDGLKESTTEETKWEKRGEEEISRKICVGGTVGSRRGKKKSFFEKKRSAFILEK